MDDGGSVSATAGGGLRRERDYGAGDAATAAGGGGHPSASAPCGVGRFGAGLLAVSIREFAIAVPAAILVAA